MFAPEPWSGPPEPNPLLRLAFVGRLVPFKGITMLLEAMQRAADERAVAAVLVGHGLLETDLRAEVAARDFTDRVRFIGVGMGYARVL